MFSFKSEIGFVDYCLCHETGSFDWSIHCVDLDLDHHWASHGWCIGFHQFQMYCRWLIVHSSYKAFILFNYYFEVFDFPAVFLLQQSHRPRSGPCRVHWSRCCPELSQVIWSSARLLAPAHPKAFLRTICALSSPHPRAPRGLWGEPFWSQSARIRLDHSFRLLKVFLLKSFVLRCEEQTARVL